MSRHTQGMPCTTTEINMTDRAARNQENSPAAFFAKKAVMGVQGDLGGHRNLSERDARGAARRSRSDRDNLWEAA